MLENLSLRKKLSVGYSAILSTTLISLCIVIYITINCNLQDNLDERLTGFTGRLIRYVNDDETELKKYHKYREFYNEESSLENLRKVINSDSLKEIDNSTDSLTLVNIVYKKFYESILNIFESYHMQIADTTGYLLWKSSNLDQSYLPPLNSEQINHDSVLSMIDRLLHKHVSISELREGILTDYYLGNKFLRLYIKYSRAAVYTVGYDLRTLRDLQKSLLLVLLISLPLMIIISIIGGGILSARALKPIDNLAKTARDITANNLSLRLPYSHNNDEMGRLSETLNQMISRLENSFAQVKQFTSDASHELKTPLTILRGELELALTKPKSANEYIRIIASSLDEVIRLTNVVESLLELSRADMGQIKISFEERSLSRLLREICDDAEILSEQKHIELTAEIEPNVFCQFDSVRLHQAILNVVENAIKYTQNNGKILITLRSDPQTAIINVKDTGMGIPEEQLPHIFDRFFRVDKSRSGKLAGSGLGLAIVNWIIKAHDGKIDVASKLNEGTVFTIYLPLRR